LNGLTGRVLFVCAHTQRGIDLYGRVTSRDALPCISVRSLSVSAHLCILPHAMPIVVVVIIIIWGCTMYASACIYMLKKMSARVNTFASLAVIAVKGLRVETCTACSEIFSPPQPLATDNQRVENFHLASSSVDLKASLSLLMAMAYQACNE
jgi:hypothetical protein